MMQLFYNQTSPYARKARVAVLEKGLQDRVTFIETDPWADPPELLRVTPLSKVPALALEDGTVLTESDAIIQALDVIGGGAHPLLPAEGRLRLPVLARAGLCQGLIDASFIATIERRRPAGGQWEDWVRRQRAAVARALQHIAASFELAPGRFDLGDIGLACALGYLEFRLGDIPWRQQYPALAGWYDIAAARPALQATRPD